MVVGYNGHRNDRGRAALFERKSVKGLILNRYERQAGHQRKREAVAGFPGLFGSMSSGGGGKTCIGERIIKGNLNV